MRLYRDTEYVGRIETANRTYRLIPENERGERTGRARNFRTLNALLRNALGADLVTTNTGMARISNILSLAPEC